MVIVVNLATLFVIGSIIGYLIELFFRRIVHKKWINPGFLIGPYLPVYGFANLMLYGLNSIPLNGLPTWSIILIKIVCNFILLTLLELVAGIIFIKTFHIKLWDYSDRWLNYKGIICPLFSLIWGILGSVYSFFIFPYLMKGLAFLNENLIYTFFVGIIIGMILVDTAYSFRLGYKLKKSSGEFVIAYDLFKEELKNKYKTLKDKRDRTFLPLIARFNKSELEKEIKLFQQRINNFKNKLKKK